MTCSSQSKTSNVDLSKILNKSNATLNVKVDDLYEIVPMKQKVVESENFEYNEKIKK
jgi:hypothetical protein